MPEQGRGLSRKDFLKALGLGSIATGLGLIFEHAYNYVPSVSDRYFSADLNGLIEDRDFVKNGYGLEIYTSVPPLAQREITGTAPSNQELSVSLREIRSAVSKYPLNYFMNNGIRGVSVMAGLKNGGVGFAGIALRSGIVAISPMGPLGRLHHEFYHLTDEGGLVQGLDSWLRNSRWEGMFGCKCEYDQDRTDLGIYVTSLGAIHPREDRAEIARFLMEPEFHRSLVDSLSALDSRAQEELVLKIAEIKEHYALWSDGRMDEQYWTDLRNGLVGEDYWKDR